MLILSVYMNQAIRERDFREERVNVKMFAAVSAINGHASPVLIIQMRFSLLTT